MVFFASSRLQCILTKEASDRNGVAEKISALHWHSRVKTKAGDLTGGYLELLPALSLSQAIAHKRLEVESLLLLSELGHRAGDMAFAAHTAMKAVVVCKCVGDPGGEAAANLNIARCTTPGGLFTDHLSLGSLDPSAGVVAAEEALLLFKRLGDLNGEGEALLLSAHTMYVAATTGGLSCLPAQSKMTTVKAALADALRAFTSLRQPLGMTR